MSGQVAEATKFAREKQDALMDFDEAGYLMTRSTLARYSNNMEEAKKLLVQAQKAGYDSPLLFQQMKTIKLMEEEKQKGKIDFEHKQYV